MPESDIISVRSLYFGNRRICYASYKTIEKQYALGGLSSFEVSPVPVILLKHCFMTQTSDSGFSVNQTNLSANC